MIRYECDRCGAPMNANDIHRFIVKLEIFAAADHLDLTHEEVANASGQLDDLLGRLRHVDPDEMEDQTYRSFRFDVCDTCRKHLIANPIPGVTKASPPPSDKT